MNTKFGSQLTFSQFAESVQPSGAVSRSPAIGKAADVFTYRVYMNGPVAALLPHHAREHTLKDVTVKALTEKLKLNSESARDNLKVAEMVALRSAWMTKVLESSINMEPYSSEVLKDYEILSNGLGHPWIKAELRKQHQLSARIDKTLSQAGVAKDVLPSEVSVGTVMAQDSNFTLQQTNTGEVVTHENRRLQKLPVVGEETMVSYYRGSGQVVQGKVRFSAPFVDPNTEDLAVKVVDPQSAQPQIVLFNNVQSYEQFVQAHGLDRQLVQSAFNVRAIRPKTEIKLPERRAVSMPYLESKALSLALDYVENGIQYTALFESAEKMGSLAREFNIGAKAIAQAHRLEELQKDLQGNEPQKNAKNIFKDSEFAINSKLKDSGYKVSENSHTKSDRDYLGPVVAATSMHIAQDIGRQQIVIHDVRTLDKLPSVGDRLNIRFKDGRGVVTDMVKSSKDIGR